MSKNSTGRSSPNFKPTRKSSKNRKTKTQANFKSRDKPKYRSGAKPNNRSRDRGESPSKRRFPSRSKGGKSDYRSSSRSGRYDDRKRGSDKEPIEFHAAVCAKCKKETQVPFKPTGVKPVFCRECFQIEKPKTDSTEARRFPSRSMGGRTNIRSSGRSSSRSSGRYEDRNRRQSDRGTTESHTVICAKCKKETTVPFKPTGVRPVLCRECFQEQKQQDEFKTDRTKKNFSDTRRRSANTRTVRPTEERLAAKPSEDSFEEKDDEVVERVGDRKGPYRANKGMHQTNCRVCKKEIIIPFKPSPNKPIYCPDCYQEKGKKE